LTVNLTRGSCRQRIVAGCGYACLLVVGTRNPVLRYHQQVAERDTTYDKQKADTGMQTQCIMQKLVIKTIIQYKNVFHIINYNKQLN